MCQTKFRATTKISTLVADSFSPRVEGIKLDPVSRCGLDESF